MENSSSAAEVDVVNAFLECLVDPFLPLGSSGPPEAPLPSEKESVAKQMHAVVLLYNYYQRKQDPEREYVGFEQFCKLAVTLKPSLRLHMKHTHDESSAADNNNKNNESLDGLQNPLSETEKAILDACNISLVLNPLKDNPNTGKWPFSKVTVLLVDSVKQNCFLLFSSVTKGVWSLVEKDVDLSNNISSESKGVGKRLNKRKGINKKTSREEQDADTAGFQQLAFSAVKEATGINQADLMVLETHVVYSLSKEKTAARFYIVQCTQSVQEDIRFPLKDLIESLQGPLVKQSFGYWIATTVAEYYRMVPYATIMSDWFSRQELYSNSVQGLKKMGLGNVHVKSSQQTENKCAEEEEEVGEIKQVLSNTRQKQNLEANVESDYNILMATDVDNRHHREQTGPHGTDVDKSTSFGCRQKDDESESMCMEGNAHHLQKKQRTCSTEKSDINALTSSVDFKAEEGESKMKAIISECRCDKEVNNGMNKKNCSSSGFSSDKDENKLSQSALEVLLRKREKLSHQLRTLEDEVAVCDQTIQTILDGGDVDMALRLQVIIDCCNEGESQYQGDSISIVGLQQSSSRQLKPNKLAEAILSLQSPCQELDDICKENNWTLPTYNVWASGGGFLANVRLKGIDFEWSGESDMRPRPVEARESAAAKIISKLRFLNANPNRDTS